MQNINVIAQTQMFLFSCGYGFLLGLLYEVFRILRMAFLKSSLMVFCQDVLYFLLCGILTFLFCLIMNYGEIRGYILIGEILGWIIYYFSIGKILFRANNKIINYLYKIIYFVFNALSVPFLYTFRLAYRFFIFLVKIIKK